MRGWGAKGTAWTPKVATGCWEPQNGFESHGEAVSHKELRNHRHNMDPKTHLGTQESRDPEARGYWLLRGLQSPQGVVNPQGKLGPQNRFGHHRGFGSYKGLNTYMVKVGPQNGFRHHRGLGTPKQAWNLKGIWTFRRVRVPAKVWDLGPMGTTWTPECI